MPDTKQSDVLILGGGPAGIQYGRMIRQLRPDWTVTMLRPEEHSMVYCAIPYAMEGLFEPEKVYKTDALVRDVGIDLVRSRAVEVDLQARRVRDEESFEHEYETLFIALGASPIRPPIPHAEAENVFTVKTREDMTGILERLNLGARKSIVVGAGAIGIEQAQAYRQRGMEVTLIDMGPHVLPGSLDGDFAEAVEEVLLAKGIDVRTGVRLERLEADSDGRVCRVCLSDGSKIELDPERDFVCMSIGMKPDVELFSGSKLDVGPDGILVDDHMRTNLPGVYAAGDCCQFHSGIDGARVGGKLATNAVPMAKVAARVAAGLDAKYPGFYNGHATCAYELRIGSTGFTERTARERGFSPVMGFGETASRFPMMPGATRLRVQVVADRDSQRILGGQVLSETPATDKVDLITLAIQQKMTLAELAQLSYSAQPWQSFFPARNAVVQACEDALTRLRTPTSADAAGMTT